MTELLFIGTSYTIIGFIFALFMRFKGFYDIAHEHGTQCNAPELYDEKRRTYIPGGRICKPRIGGSPVELILWVLRTVLWPLEIALVLFVILVWVAYKGLWIKV